MSIFTDQLQFTPDEKSECRICAQIAQLAICRWSVHAAMQQYGIPKWLGKEIIDGLQRVSDIMQATITNHPLLAQSDFEQQLLMHEEIFQTRFVHQISAFRAILREFYRATPPPYAISRTYEQWREAVTGVSRQETLQQPRQIRQQNEESASVAEKSFRTSSRQRKTSRTSRKRKKAE